MSRKQARDSTIFPATSPMRFFRRFNKGFFAVVLAILILVTQTAAVRAESTGHSLSASDARHLIARTGFGAAPTEINQLVGKDRTEAVNTIISGIADQPHTALPSWTNNTAPDHYRFASLSSQDRQNFRQVRLSEIQSLRRWWVHEMISTPTPQTERLVLFWHNHFATAYSALNTQSISIARQHMMFRQHVAGNFRDLLKAVIRDPAMLNYLDNNNSRKQKPNENLARELLELFTLGEGNYTEQDIKNAARALTGNSFSDVYDMRFVFKDWTHDKGQKVIFGKRGEFNGDDLIDLILDQPATASFITAKFWRMLVSDTGADNPKLAPHATAFRIANYDIKTLYRSILMSDDFWLQENRAAVVQSPVSLTVGAIRSTGILPTDWQVLPSKLAQMGQQLFEPPNVAGWPGGASWIAPGRLLARLEWLAQLAAQSPTQLPQDPDMAMSMSTPTMTTAMQPEAQMMKAANTQLELRMASEEFDEHVRYTVVVHGKAGDIWESGEQELKGGYDTKRMGRVESSNMPWQTIAFPVTIASEDVSAIEVSFINDGATPDGADRNLYVSRATYGARVWLPSKGKQTGKCARKNPNQQGNLYCPGTLRMENSIANQEQNNKPLAENTIRISDVSLYYIHPTEQKQKADIAFTLSDVEFDGRSWDTLTARYVMQKGDYAIHLNNQDCWPECLIKWPECAWKGPRNRLTISLALDENDERCMYTQLQESDKNLSRALWTVAEELYELTANSPKLNRSNVARNYKQWKSHIEKMVGQIKKSHYFNDATVLEIVPRPILQTTLKDTVTSPLPAGITAEQRVESTNALMRIEADLDLATLLLPTAPVNQNRGPSSTDIKLKDLLTDLAFQLK